MFLHAGLTHLVFNMLALWMFGVELEKVWGTRGLRALLLRSAGSGAAATTIVASLLPFGFADFAVHHAHGRCVRRDLRPARGVRRDLRQPADLHVLPLPGAGAHLRADHRGDHAAAVGHLVGRRGRPPDAPRRTRDGLGPPHARHGADRSPSSSTATRSGACSGPAASSTSIRAAAAAGGTCTSHVDDSRSTWSRSHPLALKRPACRRRARD